MGFTAEDNILSLFPPIFPKQTPFYTVVFYFQFSFSSIPEPPDKNSSDVQEMFSLQTHIYSAYFS